MSQLYERSVKHWAQGHPGTNSKRATCFPSTYPKLLTRQEGCYVWDTNGKKYIDFGGALGACILGYIHPKVNEYAINQIKTGYVSGSLPSALEVEVMEEIASMFPHAQKMRFLKTGSEACSAACRIARAYTNHKYIYSEGYHGHSDLFTSLTPPALGVRDKFYAQPIGNDLDWVAGFIQEPVELDMSEDRKDKLGEQAAEVHKRDGVVIYDEVITGGRVPKYSISRHWDLSPDIIVFGKGLANGFPIAILAGREEVMNCGEYFISSTFSGEAVSLAACLATLQELRKKNISDLMYYGDRFRLNISGLSKDIQIVGYGTRGMFDVTNPTAALFVQEMARAGVLFNKAWFWTFAHMEEEIEEQVMNIAHDVMTKIKQGKVKYEGELPTQTFKR